MAKRKRVNVNPMKRRAGIVRNRYDFTSPFPWGINCIVQWRFFIRSRLIRIPPFPDGLFTSVDKMSKDVYFILHTSRKSCQVKSEKFPPSFSRMRQFLLNHTKEFLLPYRFSFHFFKTCNEAGFLRPTFKAPPHTRKRRRWGMNDKIVGQSAMMVSRAISIIWLKVVCLSSAVVTSPVNRWSLTVRMDKA